MWAMYHVCTVGSWNGGTEYLKQIPLLFVNCACTGCCYALWSQLQGREPGQQQERGWRAAQAGS